MLSATPVNNRFNDLQEPARTRLRGRVGEPRSEAQHLDERREGVPRRPSGRSTSGRSCRRERAHHRRDPRTLDFDFFELLDAVTIARSRKHIQAFYDTTEIGAFPERLTADLDSRAADRPARRAGVQRDLRAAPGADPGRLHAARPTCSRAGCEKYEELYDTSTAGTAAAVEPRPARAASRASRSS